MGIYRITNGAVGKALPLTAVGGAGVANIADVPVSSSAWLFENQSGTLGTNLNGSVIYVGGAGNIRAILSGVEGIQNKVTALNLNATFTGANPFYAGFAAGSGYITGVNLSTKVVTTVPNSPATVPAGLAVDIIVPVPETNATALGTGYTGTVGAPVAFTTTGGSAGSSGLIGIITGVNGTGGITAFTITRGGQGYTAGDVLTFVSGDGINGTMTLATAPNGAVTAITINAAGANYSVGDIITVEQANSNEDCKFCIRQVESDLPIIGDAVTFTAVPIGEILPVSVDYIVATGTTATGLIACK
jgi:hypothetical protein